MTLGIDGLGYIWPWIGYDLGCYCLCQQKVLSAANQVLAEFILIHSTKHLIVFRCG